MNLTKKPGNITQIYIFRKKLCFRKGQNSSSGSDKTKIFIDKVPFTLHQLVGLMHNRTNAKEQKIGPVNAFKKNIKVSFVTFGTETPL